MDLDVLSAGAGKGLVESLQARFTAQTGVSIHATFLAVGSIMEKLLAEEPCDMVILTAKQLESLSRSGRVVADSVVPLGRVETALAVKTGEPIPDIADRDRLRRSLCAADAIYLPDAERSTAGIHLVHMRWASTPMSSRGCIRIPAGRSRCASLRKAKRSIRSVVHR